MRVPEYLLKQGDEYLLDGATLPCVSFEDDYLRRDAERLAHLGEVVSRRSVEHVDGEQEGYLVVFKVVHGRIAVLDAASVDQHDRAEGALDQVVPDERESVLTRRAEQIEYRAVVHGDSTKVER